MFSAAATVVGALIPPTFTYQWQRKRGRRWQDVPGAINANLNVNNVQSNQFGTNYRVRIGLGVYQEYSNAASIIENSVDPPSGLQATDNICTSEVDLEWQWYQQNPTTFLIEYNDGADPTQWLELNEVSGGDRQYTHDGVERGRAYLYRMRTFSDACGYYTNSSSEVEGISPSVPIAPISVQAEIQEAPSGPVIEVNWQDESDNEDGFIVAKVQDNGIIERFRIQSSRYDRTSIGYGVSYLDEDAENCQPYTLSYLRVQRLCR